MRDYVKRRPNFAQYMMLISGRRAPAKAEDVRGVERQEPGTPGLDDVTMLLAFGDFGCLNVCLLSVYEFKCEPMRQGCLGSATKFLQRNWRNVNCIDTAQSTGRHLLARMS